MSLVQIRPALGTDLADIQSCARKAYAMYVGRMDTEPAPMRADYSSLIAQGSVDLAICGSQFAGYAVFYPEGEHFHLENLGVLPEYRGCGIGRRLIEHVECAAKEAGYKAVELYTNEAMTENLALYPRIGYVEIDRRREAGFNRVFFRKQLVVQPEGYQSP